MEKLLEKLKLDIQLFAEGGEGSDDAGADSGTDNAGAMDEGAKPEPQKEMSLTELLSGNPKLQSQFDSLLAKSNETAISNAKTKWQEAQSEAEKLAKMDADQKIKYQMKKLEEQNASLQGQINATNLYKQASAIANEKEIPLSYLDLIDFSKESAESVAAKIEMIAQTRSKDLEAYLSSKVRQRAPQERSVQKIDPYIEGFKSEF